MSDFITLSKMNMKINKILSLCMSAWMYANRFYMLRNPFCWKRKQEDMLRTFNREPGNIHSYLT